MRAFLRQRQTEFEERPLEHGVQFRCKDGEIFNVYKTGRLSIQGTKTGLSDDVSGLVASGRKRSTADASEGEAQPVTSPVDRRVFIVYGHDTAVRDQLELILRRMGMDPIILENLPAAGDTIIEKLEQYLGQHGNVGFACVLLTPDDEGYPAGQAELKKYRARQNVILELGMVLSRLGRAHVAILYKASVEEPSDIAGLIYRPFQERVDEIKTKLYQDLLNAGYKPRAEGL